MRLRFIPVTTRGFIGFSIIVLLFWSLNYLFFPIQEWRGHLSNGLFLLTNSIVVALLFRAGRRSHDYDPVTGRGWTWIAIGQTMWLIGDCSYSVLVFTEETEPFPSIADVFYLLYYPFYFFGAIRLTVHKKIRDFSLANVLTVLAIAVSVFCYFWIFLLIPVIEGWQQNTAASIIALGYPLFDLFLLLSVFYLLFNARVKQHPLPIGVLSVGMFIMVFVDVMYGTMVLTGEYISSSFLSGAYIGSYCIIGLAGLFQWSALTNPHKPERRELGEKLIFINRLGLTFLAFVGVMILLVMERNLPALQPYYGLITVTFFTVAVLTGWIVALTVIENRRLVRDLAAINDRLEERIRERTRELESSYARLEQMANQDQLTGLPNRSFFLARLGRFIADLKKDRETSGALLFLDLDEFKQINDTCGHAVGDSLLVAVGERLRGCVRQCDIVARLGGDEFVVLLIDPKDCDQVRLITQRILATVHEPYSIEGKVLRISASIGILDHHNMPDVAAALQNADLAMYAAKHAGRNQSVYYSPEMRVNLPARWLQETRMQG
ncbi:MAG: GGDEF domain-containing protein [Chloroflexota bacterium]